MFFMFSEPLCMAALRIFCYDYSAKEIFLDNPLFFMVPPQKGGACLVLFGAAA